jgi:hypothetical protein
VDYFWALIVIVALSLILQLISMIFALILFFNKYPKHDVSSETPGIEMTQPVNGHDDTAPSADVSTDTTPSVAGSTDTLGIRFEGTDDLADPVPPIHLKRINDGLTVTTVRVAILPVIKNALRSGVIDTVLSI